MTSSMEQWLLHYEAGLAAVLDAEWVASASEAQLDQWLAALALLPAPEQPEQNRALDQVLSALALRTREERLRGLPPLAADRVAQLAAVYRHLGAGSPVRYRLLQILAMSGGAAALAQLADLLAESPPVEGAQVAVVFSPLIQQDRLGEMVQLFPRILHGLAHLSAGAAILDMANYLTRKRAVATHPAYELRQQLADLLGRLAMQLELLDQREQREADPQLSAEELSHRVAESVSLAVALCDALALIGDASLAGKLYQALELRHRRIQTEAAHALAKLGESAGAAALVKLAVEPVARLRVLAYAEELGILDQIPEQYRTAAARAEAALVVWLAEPTQLGIPPTRCELFDERELYWPGHSEAVECFLFKFTYEVAGARYSNIGISGPLVHSFSADLEDLSADDIYAAYAGWQTEHDEILERDPASWDDADRREVRHLEELIREEGYTSVEPQMLGTFFGQKVLIATTHRDDQEGIVMADEETVHWYPQKHHRRALGATEAFCIYKGQKLLEAFN